MLIPYVLYLILALIVGDNIYQMRKLTRPVQPAKSTAKVLSHLVFTLAIIVFIAYTMQWNVLISIFMWWLIAVTTAAYAGVAIWRVLRNSEIKQA